MQVALLAAASSVRLSAAAKEVAVEIKEPQGVQDPEECIKCHQKFAPALVAAFQASSMGKPGVQNQPIYEEAKKQQAAKEKSELRKGYVVKNGHINCIACHGDNHTTISETRGRVANAVCGGCHDAIDKEYEKGGGHSFDPPEENWKRALAAPEFFGIPSPVLQLSRDAVSSQQGATAPPYYDPDPEFEGTGRIHRNGCISCHTRHRFDPAEARKPESCQTCHSRTASSVFESYTQSKHGSIYRADGNNWSWKSKLPEALTKGELGAPTCATCHMLIAERYGDVKITHTMTGKSIWGRGLQPFLVEGEQASEAGYKAYFAQLRQQADPKRKEMILVCRNCHSEKFAGDYLNAGDQVKLSSDLLVLQARSILDGLARDGLLRASSAGLIRRYQPVAGDAAQKPAEPLTAIERAYVDLARQENVRTALGAFHESPADVYWEGFARVQQSLDHMKALETELRQGSKKPLVVSGAPGARGSSQK